jgi:hypothetical protein
MIMELRELLFGFLLIVLSIVLSVILCVVFCVYGLVALCIFVVL